MAYAMEKMQEDIHKLTKMVEDIYRLIAGHELDRESGIMHQVKDHEERLTSLEKYKEKIIYIAIGLSISIGLVAGIGTSGIIKIGSAFLK
jgi:hypothetical protein